MDTINCIKTRRSVRRFEGKSVDRSIIQEIVSAATWAPSWKNTQTPRFHVIDKPELIQDIADNGCMGFAFNQKTLLQTPVLVVLSYVTGLCGFEPDGSFSTFKEGSWQMFDAGVAAQTFALAAHEKGVGCVMLGIYDNSYIANAIQLPENEEIACLIAVGYQAFEPKVPERKDTSEVLHFV